MTIAKRRMSPTAALLKICALKKPLKKKEMVAVARQVLDQLKAEKKVAQKPTP